MDNLSGKKDSINLQFAAACRILLPIVCCLLLALPVYPQSKDIPETFVEIRDIAPSILVELRYYGTHNFLGRRVAGYEAEKCYLTRAAALGLKKVQDDLQDMGLTLKIYDAYRPQRAVDDFVAWAKDTSDQKTRREFYSTQDKRLLFKKGYIASRSGHSRGSTVDLTIVALPVPEQAAYVDGQDLCECFAPVAERFGDNMLDMGTGYDCFHENSWTDSREVSGQARANRLLLRSLMEKHGFRNYNQEWWHYTLRNEPFPQTYFDFVIK